MVHAKITAEQFQALRQSKGQPVLLVDEAGNETAVALVPFELLRQFAAKPHDIADTYPAQEAALGSVWSDPQLDEYTDNDGSPVN